MSAELFAQINTDYVGCVDGRKVDVALLREIVSGEVRTILRKAQAQEMKYPQVLGGALGFVAYLETKGIPLDEAFDLVGKAFEAAGFVPTFHTHTHKEGTDEELSFAELDFDQALTLVEENLAGCGFAAAHWQEKAKEVLEKAIEKNWSILVLGGKHNESQGGAYLNEVANTTFDTATAVDDEKAAFNADVWFIALIAQELAKLVDISAEDLVQWHTEYYKKVVVMLGGVQKAEEIVVNNQS